MEINYNYVGSLKVIDSQPFVTVRFPCMLHVVVSVGDGSIQMISSMLWNALKTDVSISFESLGLHANNLADWLASYFSKPKHYSDLVVSIQLIWLLTMELYYETDD